MSVALIWFTLGFAVAAAIAWLRACRAEAQFRETLISIYQGFGEPDEAGRVGWFRDNRNGSPFYEAGNIVVNAKQIKEPSNGH